MRAHVVLVTMTAVTVLTMERHFTLFPGYGEGIEEIRTFENVGSATACGMTCLQETRCNSFLYIINNKTDCVLQRCSDCAMKPQDGRDDRLQWFIQTDLLGAEGK